MKLLEVEWIEAQHDKRCTSASFHAILIKFSPWESRGQESSVFGVVNEEDNMRWWVNWLWWWQWAIFQHLRPPCNSPSFSWYWLPHRTMEGVSRQVTLPMLGHPTGAKVAAIVTMMAKKYWRTMECWQASVNEHLAVRIPLWRVGECLQISANFKAFCYSPPTCSYVDMVQKFHCFCDFWQDHKRKSPKYEPSSVDCVWLLLYAYGPHISVLKHFIYD